MENLTATNGIVNQMWNETQARKGWDETDCGIADVGDRERSWRLQQMAVLRERRTVSSHSFLFRWAWWVPIVLPTVCSSEALPTLWVRNCSFPRYRHHFRKQLLNYLYGLSGLFLIVATLHMFWSRPKGFFPPFSKMLALRVALGNR